MTLTAILALLIGAYIAFQLRRIYDVLHVFNENYVKAVVAQARREQIAESKKIA